MAAKNSASISSNSTTLMSPPQFTMKQNVTGVGLSLASHHLPGEALGVEPRPRKLPALGVGGCIRRHRQGICTDVAWMRLNSVRVSGLLKNAPASACSYQETKSRALPASVITSLSGRRMGPGGFS